MIARYRQNDQGEYVPDPNGQTMTEILEHSLARSYEKHRLESDLRGMTLDLFFGSVFMGVGVSMAATAVLMPLAALGCGIFMTGLAIYMANFLWRAVS